MKVGDLVKYKKSLRGLEKCMGVIIGLDGGAFVIQWLDRYSRKRGQFNASVGRETSVEVPEFLEVVSGARN